MNCTLRTPGSSRSRSRTETIKVGQRSLGRAERGREMTKIDPTVADAVREVIGRSASSCASLRSAQARFARCSIWTRMSHDGGRSSGDITKPFFMDLTSWFWIHPGRPVPYAAIAQSRLGDPERLSCERREPIRHWPEYRRGHPIYVTCIVIAGTSSCHDRLLIFPHLRSTAPPHSFPPTLLNATASHALATS